MAVFTTHHDGHYVSCWENKITAKSQRTMKKFTSRDCNMVKKFIQTLEDLPYCIHFTPGDNKGELKMLAYVNDKIKAEITLFAHNNTDTRITNRFLKNMSMEIDEMYYGEKDYNYIMNPLKIITMGALQIFLMLFIFIMMNILMEN